VGNSAYIVAIGGIMRKFYLYMIVTECVADAVFAIRDFIKRDIRSLVYMLKPIKDVENGRKLYREVEKSCDHDASQHCIFCDSVQPTCTVTTGDGDSLTFCNTCGFELVAYDMENV
jgi:hypothetical protein